MSLEFDQDVWKVAVLAAYFLTLLLLSFYGSHRYLMVHLYRKFGGEDPTAKIRFTEDDLPVVTVQIPLYNERYVAERVIQAVCELDYPRERLEIQVLDDSTDDTTEIVSRVVERFRVAGIDIHLIHRTNRTGYKAGALQAGLEIARGEFVAVFDADFVPQASFLRDTIHHFTDSDIGMVQARWGYINRGYSLLTRAQAVLLDGHFVLEHTARNRSGRFFNFNGTAGIWRNAAIEDAGGWEHHTLTEDLDLSYRAQLKGWKFVFLRDLVVPSEIPVEMNAFKAQQHRWAKGSMQTAKKLLPRVLRSDLPFKIKLEAFHHLTGNVAYLLMVILAVLMPMATLVRVQHGWHEVMLLDVPIFLSATFSVCYFYWVSQREVGRSRMEIIRLLPAVLGVGIGVSVNNAKGVFEALVGYKTPFVRTPKYAIEQQHQGGDAWLSKLYIRKANLVLLLEFGFGLWFSFAIWTIFMDGRYNVYSLPFLMLFQFGYFYVALLSVAQTLMVRRVRG